ncbi:hypothetical protein B0175_10670 [Arcobacter lacus]|uniref:Diguanylate cyclase/phosphodiesterase n=2 Tax=Arcobacter lacus TaxID=1912876 RepID=A0ABX5JFD5_9BACT|nr:hypothetical protein B0175_10670 [Arcobacter lacus]
MIRSHTSYIEKLEDEIIKRTKDIQIFAKIFENSKEGIIITDARKTILNVNDAFVNITGFSKEETIGKTPFILNSKKQNREFYKKMWKDIHSKGIWQGEIINKRKDGKNITEFLTIMKLYVKKTIYYVSIFTDISEKFLNQQMLEYLATHDSLTGLLNRNEILSKIDSSINQVEKNKNLLALIFIDLDDFKKINDTMGHVMGDKFLIDLSTKLSSILQKKDTLARLGGDEFIILLENLEKIGDENSIIEKLKDIFSKPIVIEGKEFDVSASIGVVFYPNDNSDDSSLQNLLRKVDLAMYKSKENGKNKVIYYNKELESKFQTKLLLEKDLKEALKNNKLELCLQAKKNFHTEKTNSAEALLRWNNNGENISPSIFIPIAEESNLIKEIDEWVVNKSLDYLKDLHSCGHPTFIIALNISAKTLSDKKFLDSILKSILHSGLINFIEIEITEGIFIENLDRTSKIIEKMKSQGISIALDDFGTGYSSFSYLHKLSLNKLKIDKSFISNLNNDLKQQVLVDSMISFSKKLGIQVIAEGIETSEQYEWLKKHNCDYGQGYLFSKAVPLDKLKELL